MNQTKKRTGVLGRFKSIQSSIFAAISLLVLCAVIIVTMVSIRYTQSSIYDNAVVYTRTIIHQMNQNIDSYITYMDNIATMISAGEDAMSYLFQDDSVEKEAGHSKRLVEQFFTILKSRADIKNIGIIRKDGKALFNYGLQVINPYLDINTQSWFADAVGSGNSVLTSSHVQHVIKGERPWVITLSRFIPDYTDGGGEGVVFIDLNYSAISELCDQNSIGDKGYVFILDQDGNIVYHPQQQQLYNELQTENIDLVMNADSETVTWGSGDNAKMYTLSRSEKTGWTVVGCMNMAELTRDSRKAQSIYVVMAVALVIVALFLSSVIARNITMPIQSLRDSMAKVQEGDFSKADVEVSTQNEIGSLTKSFNVMTYRIQELMEQNVHEQEEKRKSEMKALQAQINPHFLYNTLDSIIWMAEGKKNEEVVLMTASLARLLRQSISNEDEVVSVSQEIEYARSYLTIQKMRYKDKLEFQIDVEPSIGGAQIVKLVLQPIIENAIYHGLKYKESKGLLLVHGYQDGENVVIKIQDNGVGMDAETLAHIFDRHKVNYRSNGVGVYNVQQRLQLYYGSDYGITYQSEKGKGTTATITFPKKLEVRHE
ncbi:cache domain-containing protein [Ruminococcus sp. 5_1_39BFAA]|uniref:sensor histidine kinase n=1 Tax=Ruminococcus sp. 5_1_39BFAA TaxID=457412 RepID=UPI0035634905